MIKGVTDRIDALDGIRGIAILLVIAVHWAKRYFPGGYVGVDVFFVLSGFLITAALWKSRSAPGPKAWLNFQRRRLERLYPALTVFLVVGTGIVAILSQPLTGAQAARASLLAIIQASTFVAGSGSHALGPFNHTWSLSVEWLFYLMWPLFILAARRRLAPGVTGIVTLALAGLMYALSANSHPDWFYYGPVSRSAQILVGASIALLLASGRRFHVPSAAGLAGVALLAIWAVAGPLETQVTYRLIGFPLATVAAALLLGCALQRKSLGAKLLAWQPLALVGRVSYSLYLWHFFSYAVLTAEGSSVSRPAAAVMIVLSTAALTTASYLLVERPVLNRSARRRHIAAAELAAS